MDALQERADFMLKHEPLINNPYLAERFFRRLFACERACVSSDEALQALHAEIMREAWSNPSPSGPRMVPMRRATAAALRAATKEWCWTQG